MPKHIILFICFLLMFLPIRMYGRNIDKDEARRLAVSFLNAHNEGMASRAFTAKKLVERPLPEEAEAYLFGTESGKFVVVSRRDDLPSVLGYGDNGLGDVHEGVKVLATLQGRGTYRPMMNEDSEEIEPFVPYVRHQKAPFNGSCPYYSVNGIQQGENRCMVGCVATSLEQILTYYHYPEVLQDTLWGWETAHYKVDTIPKGTPLHFDRILERYDEGHYTEEQMKAVCDLCYYCGIAAHTQWGLNDSGAWVSDLVEPLKKSFGYTYVHDLWACNYTPERWRELIDTELRAGRPVYYAGYTSLNQGHTFVIDGKDKSGFYHIRWGYNGNYDGYYDLNVLNAFENPLRPTETGSWLGFFCNQEMLLIGKEEVEFVKNDTIHEHDNIVIDSVKYSRTPDGNGYVRLDLYVKNKTDENISTTVLIYTAEADDSTAFKKADAVGITGMNLSARETGMMSAYCRFNIFGKRVLHIFDGVIDLHTDTMEIQSRSGKGVIVEEVDTFCKGLTYNFSIHIQNESEKHWAGNMLTYSLFEGDYTTAGGEWRQWSVMNLPPSGGQTDTISFGELKPGTRYTFVVRNPWLPAYTLPFTTPLATRIESLEKAETSTSAYFGLDGKPIKQINQNGIYLKKSGNKYKKVLIMK